ncbi:MAG: tripartite tricarboxylate transporter substrate binding protein [Rhodospirillaceae bacterium]|jgi:tripartite-type tricarboxylate transporter receptor subunit TctC|nr:tripartite tricarboxylate transporter substrate binding protein [Rhodospirillaceae bacterium]MBT3885473.1 tripartite tricarboxylate transporter substrate binding protein [Rhodospirillaceae bacterium]MBT4115839.1 tripartite tricarboxylate transporter substrate binding protein [Rhodospirillaceae bacterium]MBT4672549.1 tripartite tricarboxylate transporter substrate binding protein [Rhodospirillaceae bacterium]MBT4720218.1 tripartite tricarboxylate transporter substrate binding protein [Rhodosp
MKKAIVLSLVGGVALAGAMAATTDAHAAPSFACSTAKLIVPWGPGGGTAVIFGVFEKSINATGVKPALKVVTMPGAGGTKGAKAAFKAKADGCTLFAVHQSILVSYINEVTSFNWDGFDTVAMVTDTPEIIGAGGHVKYNDLKGMLAAAKAAPGKIPTGVSMGATSHFLWILLGAKTGTTFKYVPFQGGTAGRITGLLNKSIDLGGINMAAARTQRKDGKLKAFAIAADKRSNLLPDLPTLKELGVNMNFSLTRGVVAPKGTPMDKINHWAGVFKKATENEKFKKSMAAKGTSLVYKGPADYATWFKATNADFEVAGKAVKMGRYK